jgi:hypothetical protein
MHTYLFDLNADFTCKYCGAFVSAQKAASGVINRNHCPYCLYSRHVDLFEAGDRLCACKELMVPVGLTLKKSRDKYSLNQPGELMLVHRCQACGDLSINRIAADDDPFKILAILNQKPPDAHRLLQACQEQDIVLLADMDRSILQSRLFGSPYAEIPDAILVGENY